LLETPLNLSSSPISSPSSSDQMQRERAWVEVNLAAIGHNVRQIRRRLAPETALMSIVKADAYGHGAVPVAGAVLAAGATWLGVATIPEGIELRQAGIGAPILVLGATTQPEQVQLLAQWQIQPTLCTPQQALMFSEALAATPSGPEPLPVHLKLDTGMSRLGTDWSQAVAFVRSVQALPNLRLASLYSHLATADDPDRTVMDQQHQQFAAALAACGIDWQSTHRPMLHLANSAGALADRALQYDLVRTGLITYGLYPAAHLQASIDLRPALQVKARVTQVKTIAQGTGVSYSHRFVADRDMPIAVIGIGYADGVPRRLSGQMTVLIRGQRVRQIGAITMDQIMLDVSNLPDLAEGEVVTLLGRDGAEQISADDWADALGTISWEILCGFKHRLPRVTVG
jgi:alanine racemase